MFPIAHLLPESFFVLIGVGDTTITICGIVVGVIIGSIMIISASICNSENEDTNQMFVVAGVIGFFSSFLFLLFGTLFFLVLTLGIIIWGGYFVFELLTSKI